VLTTASITLNGKIGISRYGKTNGPIARRRQPINPAQSAFIMSGFPGIVLLTPLGLVSACSARNIPEAMLERPLFFVSTPG
jgi:hypothetical protein